MLELGGIVILGILAQWAAWKLKVPAILPLIISGLVVGPLSTLWSADGSKWISPIWNGTSGLFPGESLFHFVELSIGIILFEGGMTLKKEEVRGVGETIGKLISLGALITFLSSTLLAHFLMDLNWSISFLFAALIIVTGPTVIAPILRNVPLKRNVATVLKWEGILIDPIGALAAVLVYEFISTSGAHGANFTVEAISQFLLIILESLTLGTLAAFALRAMLKRNMIPHYLLTIFSLAYVLALFILSSSMVNDSGLLTVVVAGMVLGNIDVPFIDEITYFKESLSILLISVLFILLSANIDMEDLMLLQHWRPLLLFLSIILLVRPLSVFMSTRTSTLTLHEKLFISWMGPRGIVAAGIASLFGLKLLLSDFPQAEYITPLVFMVVLGTVLLNATTAKLIARLLGVTLESSDGILIIGASDPSRLIAEYLQNIGTSVTLVDSNKTSIINSEEKGLQAIYANIYNDDLSENLNLNEVGIILALTGSSEVNNYAVSHLKQKYGKKGAYRLVTSDELKNPSILDDKALFSANDDFINLSEVARDHPYIHEYEIQDDLNFSNIFNFVNDDPYRIPLFIRQSTGKIQIIMAKNALNNLTTSKGDMFVFMGEKIDFTLLHEDSEE